MKNVLFTFLSAAGLMTAWGDQTFERDIIPVEGGEVAVTSIGHGTLMFEYGGTVIHVDPVSDEADYKTLPDADIVLITHGHGDHLDPKAVAEIRKEGTVVILTKDTEKKLKGGTVMESGETLAVGRIGIEAVPAYNTSKGRSMFHPKGIGNGYILTMGNTRFYVAGDTEDIPEMYGLKDIAVAFLPVNQPYTMTPAQAVKAAKGFRPRILYPYHYGKTNVREIVDGLAGEKDIEVRVRKLD